MGFRWEHKLWFPKPGTEEQIEKLVQFDELGGVVDDDQTIRPYSSKPWGAGPDTVDTDQDQRTALRQIPARPVEPTKWKVRKLVVRFFQGPKRHVGARCKQGKVVKCAPFAPAEGIGEGID